MMMASLLLSLLAAGSVASAQNTGNPRKTLHEAAREGDLEQIQANLDKGADVNKADSAGMPPLSYAAENAGVDAVNLLLKAGANVNAKGYGDRTALMGATQRGSKESVDALLAAGADVKARDSSQMTALHIAAQWGWVEIAEALIKAGADVNAEDATKQTPLLAARSRGQVQVVDLLKKHGATEPVLMDGLYGNAEGTRNPAEQGPVAPAPVAHTADVEIDPNAIREQLAQFEGLVVALQAVDANSAAEQRAWVQRRTDNRTVLVRSTERQFDEELAFIKKVATEEKAAKTVEAIDLLSGARKQRTEAISDALREERREMMQQGVGMTRGRTAMRSTRTRSAGGMNAQGGTDLYGPGGAGTSAASRRREPNEPPMDADTQQQVQAWRNSKPESKDSLLDAVHKLNLAELADLRVIALEEEAKKTAATISGLMLAHEERVQKIKLQWQADDERQQRLQERMGTDGTMRGRGTQTGTGQTRRYR
jgi:hypothetical protein